MFAYFSVLAVDKEGGKASPDKVKDLLKQKLAIVKQLYEGAQVRHRQGAGDAAAVRQAKAAMLQVQLALSETREERIRLHEEMVESAREHEKEVAHLVRAAVATSSEAWKATIHRLDAEIELERAKVAVKP
jgi:hypothetical protein